MTPTGPDDEFVADVLARTSGPVCARARLLLGGALDEPLGTADRALVDDHLRYCTKCRAVAETLPALVAELPELAEAVPDAGFTARVLAATSGRPRRHAWHDRWLAWWTTAAARPRFAWEAAYALTLVLVLLVGDPVRAWDSAAARLQTWSPSTLDVRLPIRPGALAHVDSVVASRFDAVYGWLEARVQTVATVLSTLRSQDSAARSSAWDSLAEMVSRWGRRVLAWAKELIAGRRPSATEPTREPVRSSNHTEMSR